MRGFGFEHLELHLRVARPGRFFLHERDEGVTQAAAKDGRIDAEAPNHEARSSSVAARIAPTSTPSRTATAVSRREIEAATSAGLVRSILVRNSPSSACAYARFTTSAKAGARAMSSAT
jgi:hypothetical protein